MSLYFLKKETLLLDPPFLNLSGLDTNVCLNHHLTAAYKCGDIPPKKESSVYNSHPRPDWTLVVQRTRGNWF